MEPTWPYIVLIGAVIIVGSMIMPKKNRHKSDMSSQSVQSMELALESFMEHMEKDNKELLVMIAESQQQAKLETARQDRQLAEMEQRCNKLEQEVKAYKELPKPITTIQATSGENEVDLTASVAQVHTIQDRYKELFVLHDKGKSIEAIAKSLGLNKGEVQLIIQLSKQEEARHV